jgi:hypothetical protein
MAHTDTDYVNLGWCASRVDQVIPLLDFCFRNGIDLHSADYDFVKASEQAPEKLAEIKTALGADADYLKQRFQYAYFSLNETSPPFNFPSPSAGMSANGMKQGFPGWLSKVFVRKRANK